jgi:hypothetical protein
MIDAADIAPGKQHEPMTYKINIRCINGLLESFQHKGPPLCFSMIIIAEIGRYEKQVLLLPSSRVVLTALG